MSLFSLALAIAATSASQETNLSIADPKALVPYLQSKGYQARFEMKDDTPVIHSGVGGQTFGFVFQGCKSGRNCADVTLVSAWKSDVGRHESLEKINQFNRDNRFGRAYIDNEDDPILEMEVMFTEHQLSAKSFDESLEVWASVLSAFAKHINVE